MLLANDLLPNLNYLLLLLTNFSILTIGFLLVRNYLLIFNRQLFYILGNILFYISNYSKDKKCEFFYINIVKQATKIFNSRLAFLDKLIKVLKKYKSFAI